MLLLNCYYIIFKTDRWKNNQIQKNNAGTKKKHINSNPEKLSLHIEELQGKIDKTLDTYDWSNLVI